VSPGTALDDVAREGRGCGFDSELLKPRKVTRRFRGNTGTGLRPVDRVINMRRPLWGVLPLCLIHLSSDRP